MVRTRRRLETPFPCCRKPATGRSGPVCRGRREIRRGETHAKMVSVSSCATPQDVAWRFRRKDGIPTESTVRLSRIGTVVVGFLAGHPETSVDLRTGDVMIDLVREGFDLAIMPTSPPDSTPVKRRLAVWRYVVCAAPAYLEKHAPPQSRPTSRPIIACSTPTRCSVTTGRSSTPTTTG